MHCAGSARTRRWQCQAPASSPLAGAGCVSSPDASVADDDLAYHGPERARNALLPDEGKESASVRGRITGLALPRRDNADS
jgi:hypothetical protein